MPVKSRLAPMRATHETSESPLLANPPPPASLTVILIELPASLQKLIQGPPKDVTRPALTQ
eukprot:3390150-Pyramimonas_sp.AAC.1